MDYLDRLGSLALGSRLKRLSERLAQEVAEVYSLAGLDFEPKWFPLFRLLVEKDIVSVTDAAAMLGITHPAVNQVAQELTKAGLIASSSDKADGRRRLLSLSSKGKKLAADLDPVWQALHCAISDVFSECDSYLLNAVAAAERAMDRLSLPRRYQEISSMLAEAKPEVVEYSAELSPHFARLNKAWIEKFFKMEESDFKVFANPKKIVEQGGMIFFARAGDKVVGTCALIKVDKSTFELVKMAVDEAYQGMGLGRLLLQASVDYAKGGKAKAVVLETNSQLKSAVKLYEKFGFQSVKAVKSPYKRVDLVMRLELPSKSHGKKKQIAMAR